MVGLKKLDFGSDDPEKQAEIREQRWKLFRDAEFKRMQQTLESKFTPKLGQEAQKALKS